MCVCWDMTSSSRVRLGGEISDNTSYDCVRCDYRSMPWYLHRGSVLQIWISFNVGMDTLSHPVAPLTVEDWVLVYRAQNAVSQRTRDIMITSLFRSNRTTPSFWRNNDVIVTSCKSVGTWRQAAICGVRDLNKLLHITIFCGMWLSVHANDISSEPHRRSRH